MNQYITKPYKQRTSTVTSIPRDVRRALNFEKGDYLIWEVSQNSYFVQISKFIPRGKSNERCNRNSDREDQGG
jgi:bifunctional DNA-binding transcriptional regulator/antitoxin component of YhaV-PrlF toxin-antitoxin module